MSYDGGRQMSPDLPEMQEGGKGESWRRSGEVLGPWLEIRSYYHDDEPEDWPDDTTF